MIDGFQLDYPPLCSLVRAGDGWSTTACTAGVTRDDDRSIEFCADAERTAENNRGLMFSRELHPGFPSFFRATST